ncbi:MAG: zinc ribbon domain-containing protein [Anaerovoracaceae bacterium]
MYCVKCGQFLAGNAKFCSNCGTKVEDMPVENDSIKVMAPGEDMKWDLRVFPSNQKDKVEDTTFDWGTDDLYAHSRYKKEVVTGVEDENEGFKSGGFKFKEDDSLNSMFSDVSKMFNRKGDEPSKDKEEVENQWKSPLDDFVGFEVATPVKSIEVDPDFVDRHESLNLSNDYLEERKEEIAEGFLTPKAVEEEELIKSAPLEDEVDEISEPVMAPSTEPARDTKIMDVEQSVSRNTMTYEKYTVPPIEEIKEVAKEEARAEMAEAVTEDFVEIEEIKKPEVKEVKKPKGFLGKIKNFFIGGDEEEEYEEDVEDEPVSGDDIKNAIFPDSSQPEIDIEDIKTQAEGINARASTLEPSNPNIETNPIGQGDELVGTINPDEEKIDKFYTFSKKNEEFQKLLDQEYERIERKIDPNGMEDDVEGFMDVHKGPMMDATSQIEEMARAREAVFSGNNVYLEGDEVVPQRAKKKRGYVFGSSEDEDGESSEEGPTLNSKEKIPVVIEQFTLDLDEEMKVVEKAKTEDTPDDIPEDIPEGKEKQASSIVYEPTKDGELKITSTLDDIEPNKVDLGVPAKEEIDIDDVELIVKPSKLRGVIIFLVVVALIIAVLIGIRVTTPTALISKGMDKISNKVFELVGADQYTEQSKKDNQRDYLVEDKTTLILLHIDDNYKDNLDEIKNAETAKYDPKEKYEFKNLKKAKDIQKNLWYEDSKGVTHYYDEEMVGAIISAVSQRDEYLKNGDKTLFTMVKEGGPFEKELLKLKKIKKKLDVTTLAIGDIKVEGDHYYVWTKEKIGNKYRGNIYQLSVKDDEIIVNDRKDN